MKTQGVKLGILVFFCMLFVGTVARAGWVLTESDGGTTTIADGKMKSFSEGGGVIMDGPKNRIVFIDQASRRYGEGTPEEYCSAITSVFEAAMQRMPPEMRQMMQSQGGASGKVTVRKKGAGGTVAGFKTERYEVSVGGKKYEEIWLSRDKRIMKDYKKLIPVFKKFSACSAKIGFGSAHRPEGSPEYLKILDRGIIVKSVSYQGGQEEPDYQGGQEKPDTDVMRLEEKTVPASAFQLPPGYRKVSFSEFFGGGMQ